MLTPAEVHTVPEEVIEVNVPTEVNEDAVIPAASVAPVKVPAAAVTTISPVPSNETVLIVLGVSKAVAVSALPVIAAVIPPLTIKQPTIQFCVAPAISVEQTAPDVVMAVSVPTEVREEAVTVPFSVAPVNVPAAAVTVIFAVPSNPVPLIVLEVSNAVAVEAFPVKAPTKEGDPIDTPAHILKAVQNPVSLNSPIKHMQQARTYLNWMTAHSARSTPDPIQAPMQA
jgi:hypothetical protein